MTPTFGSLRPTPSPFASGRTTPLSAQPLSAQPSSGSGSKPQPQKAAADSFSNLVNFSSAKSTQKLSLAERQAQLEAEKRKQAEEQRRQVEAQFGNGQFWDNLGSRGGNGSPAQSQTPAAAAVSKDDDDDLFAAFNKDTKVDTSSHLPAPERKSSTPANNGQLDLSNPSAWGSASGNNGDSFPEEDDDPFGLSEMKSSKPAASKLQMQDDDDFLDDEDAQSKAAAGTWRRLSFDAFAPPDASAHVPVDPTPHVAAYKISTPRRIGQDNRTGT